MELRGNLNFRQNYDSMKRYIAVLLLPLLIVFSGTAQETYPTNGVKDIRSGHYALTNATIHTSYNKSMENATLIIKDGIIQTVSPNFSVPVGAVKIDMGGNHIYPAFIELLSDYGMPEVEKGGSSRSQRPQFVSKKKGPYAWNEAIRPENDAYEVFEVDAKKAKSLREAGFGAALTHINDGIARGTGTVVALADKASNEMILKDRASTHYSMSKGSSKMSYPNSMMGVIALVRQTFLDADWYKRSTTKKEQNISLDSWNKSDALPKIYEVGDKLTVLRVDKMGDEFSKQFIIKGGGDSYQRIDEIKATGAPLIVPVNYPDAYDVEDPLDAYYVALSDMKHWEMAAHNAMHLSKAGIDFAFTSDGLKNKKDFLKNVRKAVEAGLSKEAALKALTYAPAKMIGMERNIGGLQKGHFANFIVTSGDIFDEDCKIYENWSKGEQLVLASLDRQDLEGNYNLKVDGSRDLKLRVKNSKGSPKMSIVVNDTTDISVKHKISGDKITLTYAPTEDSDEVVRLSGWIDGDTWKGTGQDATGKWGNWKVNRRTALEKEDEMDAEKGDDKMMGKKDKMSKDDADEMLGQITYPFNGYGWTEMPKAETVLITNATVWTNESDGILENADVLIRNGKIAQVGKGIKLTTGRKIDGTGKHVTSGVIDEHSHIAISRGVNEGSQASTAEVRIGDVVNSEDINIYRQLAGGVTAAQLLHGSANPIGGQSALVKLRWGHAPEDMKIEGADGFIKFALGENVKQSNWGDLNTYRFPQSRMGVEQVFIDYFQRAKEYNPATDRRDLDLEAIKEIIDKKRFITCHSYVQSEINMLMKTAEMYGFNVNTFTHILEGYKLADKMKEHGVGGSTFSDWWAYKFEVNDAIPYNAAIMNEMGVVTAINSDDAEMARRLNTETAKTVKYGGVSPEDAWKMVTLNPAKLLHLEDQMGSLKAGKDADVVVWSGNPLEVYSVAEQTFVDGVCYWDINEDIEKRKAIIAERNRLIQKMIQFKKDGGKTKKRGPKPEQHYHCDHVDDYCSF